MMKTSNLTNKDYHKLSTVYQIKVKIFCALHSPAGSYIFYELVVLLLIIVNCFVVNIMCDFNSVPNQTPVKLLKVMTFIDIILLTILTLELILRLLVVNCIEYYYGIVGKFKYLNDYKVSRVFDLYSIAIFLAFVCSNLSNRKNDPKTILTYRILHLTQLIQFYRIFARMFKNFINVVVENMRLLVMTISLFVVVLILLSYSVYLIELESNYRINTIFDSLWFAFITVTTIGYGDVIIKTGIAKVLTVFLVICGYCVFSLSSTIIGSALAMQLEDKRQTLLCFNPAAILIQKVWRYYAINRIPGHLQKFIMFRMKQKSKASKELTNKDKYALLFIFKLSLILAQNRFKYANLVHSTGSVPLQYVRLQRKIVLINNAVRKHKSEVYKIHHQLKKISHDLNKSLRTARIHSRSQFKPNKLNKEKTNVK